MNYTWIGFIATFISAVSLLPTVYTTVVAKSTHSINYMYVALGFLAQITWAIYAIFNKDWPVLILAIYLMIVFVIIATSKFTYEKKGLDVHSQITRKRLV
jgi:uncharacterized protein with PQ loop repeat